MQKMQPKKLWQPSKSMINPKSKDEQLKLKNMIQYCLSPSTSCNVFKPESRGLTEETP